MPVIYSVRLLLTARMLCWGSRLKPSEFLEPFGFNDLDQIDLARTSLLKRLNGPPSWTFPKRMLGGCLLMGRFRESFCLFSANRRDSVPTNPV